MVMTLLKRGAYLLLGVTITLAVSAGLRHCLQPEGYQLVPDEHLSATGCDLVAQAFMQYTDPAMNNGSVTASGFLDCVRHYLPHVVSVSIRKYPSGQAAISVGIADPFVAIETEGQIRHLYTNGILAESGTLASWYARKLPVVAIESKQPVISTAKIVSDLMSLQHIITLLRDDSACECQGLTWISSREIWCAVVNETIGESLTILLDSTYSGCQAAVRKAVELYVRGSVPAPCKADVRFDGQIVFMKGGAWDEEM